MRGGTNSLSKEGVDTGLAGILVVAVINGRGRAAINVGDGLECLVGERQVAGGAGGVEDDCRGCLLYTSPSPRDGLLSRMPSSA